ncbi:T9SS type A sorting domain-containing protein [Melioribacter sp. OK-6-Me]|uniref:T9SS type A sorting domain-containing protein n=1 Tax=unclassified Melioribacter TaxID=2627329 RepID=UPI003EDA599C
MKKIFSYFFFFAIFIGVAYGQNNALVKWNLTENQEVTLTEGNVLGLPATGHNIEVKDYTGVLSDSSTGPLGKYQRWWTGNNWPNESSENPERYIEFTVFPLSGYKLTVTNVSFYMNAGGTGKMKANVYYSIESNFANPIKLNGGDFIEVGRDTPDKYSFDLTETLSDHQKIYVRIYPWLPDGSTNPYKYLFLQEFIISGIASESNEQLPMTVVTNEATNITSFTAVLNGSVIYDNNDAILERGFCLNLNGNPTIEDTKIVVGNGAGSFTTLLDSLKPGTKYYYRAFARTSGGIYYGIEMNFVTKSVPSNIVAFPGAEGYGRFTSGGRGGAVYEVTTLEDNNEPGSLRYAVNQSGPRTVVFRVSGTIRLKSKLTIKNDNITIAGQTAPGDGICIADYPVTISANNVIVRYIRFRLGDIYGIEDDAFNGREKSNIIIDHCSMSWSIDEAASFYDNENFTMQWCIISESLNQSKHAKGPHGYGGIWGGMGATFHHNLLAHHKSRNPRFNGSRYHRQPEKEIVDFVNNVIYNWGENSAYGGEEGNQNVRINYYKAGPATNSDKVYRIVNPTTDGGTNTGYGKFYVADNFVFGYPDVTVDNWTKGVQGITSELKSQIKAATPFPIAEVTVQSAEEAFELVLQNAGATLPKRDPIDARIVEETRTGTATYGKLYGGGGKGIIDSQEDVGGWPELKTYNVPVDSDHDGMPNDWEIANGLDPNNPEDRNNVREDGYTFLEIYLNELATISDIKSDDPELPANFNLNQNYPNPFNPSTRIDFSIKKAGYVKLSVYDLLGREVANLYKGILNAGMHSINFDATGIASGVYFYRLDFDGKSITKKMLISR